MSRLRDTGLGMFEKKLQRSTARKAVARAVVRIDPIEGAIGFDFRAGGQPQRVQTAKFRFHGRGGHGRFPNAALVRTDCGRLGGLRRNRCAQQDRSENARCRHRMIHVPIIARL